MYKLSDLKEKPEDLFNQYWRYSQFLKNWFIGYGIGAIVLIINSWEFFDRMSDTIKYLSFMCIFLAISFQVVVTFLNKYSQYYLYLGKLNYIKEESNYFQKSFGLSKCGWMDWLADSLTIVFYLSATVLLLCSI